MFRHDLQTPDLGELEKQINRLDSFRKLANMFICEPKRRWNDDFIENVFTVLDEMGEAAQQAHAAFYGPDDQREAARPVPLMAVAAE